MPKLWFMPKNVSVKKASYFTLIISIIQLSQVTVIEDNI